MDLDIGTIIYIIITIVAIVAGARGKKKKPGANPATKSSESKIEGFMSKLGVQLEGLVDEGKDAVTSLKEEYIPGEKDADPLLQAEEVIIDHEAEAEQVRMDSIYKDFEGEFDSGELKNMELIASEAMRSTDDSQIADVIMLGDISNSKHSKVLDEFDLQTAVIYSTIINRLEY